MSNSSDQHIADTIAAVREEARRWSAVARAERVAARAANTRTGLLVMVLCTVLTGSAMAVCPVALRSALGGALIAVPVVLVAFGLSVSLPFYVVGAVAAYASGRRDMVPPRRVRLGAAITMTGRALLMGTAVSAVLSGLLVAANGWPVAAVLGVVLAVGVAALGRGLAQALQDAKAA